MIVKFDQTITHHSKELALLSRLWSGTIEAFLLRATGIGLLFLMHTVLGRFVGPEAYGIFSYALAVAGVLSVVVPLGLPTALMRFIAQYREQQRWGMLRGALFRAHQITFISSVLAALAMCGVTYWQIIPASMASSLRFAALLLPILAFVRLRRMAFQGLQQVKASIIPEDVLLPLVVISGMFAFTVTTVSQAVLLYFFAALLVFVCGSVWLWYSLPIQGCNAPLAFQTREWMATALPMVFGGISQIILNYSGVLMLGAMVDMEAAGLYGAANRIAILNTFVLGAVNTIAAPMLAASFHGSRAEQFKAIIHKGMLWSTIGTTPLFTIMVIWPQGLLGFFGPGFIRGGLLLQVLACGQFVNAVCGPVGYTLLMTGHERKFAQIMSFTAVINILLNYFLISRYGALGAAVATCTSTILWNLWMLINSKSIIIK